MLVIFMLYLSRAVGEVAGNVTSLRMKYALSLLHGLLLGYLHFQLSTSSFLIRANGNNFNRD